MESLLKVSIWLHGCMIAASLTLAAALSSQAVGESRPTPDSHMSNVRRLCVFGASRPKLRVILYWQNTGHQPRDADGSGSLVLPSQRHPPQWVSKVKSSLVPIAPRVSASACIHEHRLDAVCFYYCYEYCTQMLKHMALMHVVVCQALRASVVWNIGLLSQQTWQNTLREKTLSIIINVLLFLSKAILKMLK